MFCCKQVNTPSCARVESTALSLLYKIALEVPDIARLKQIKEREKAELANPFNSKRLKEMKRKEDKAKAKAEPKWRPHMPVFASCAPCSAADMANQSGKLTSRNVMTAAAQEAPSADDPPEEARGPQAPRYIRFQGTTCPSSASCEESQTDEGTLRPFFMKTVPDTAHIPFLPSRQALISQPLQLEVVGDKRSSRGRSASQPETSKGKKPNGT
jgi:hypothetical protein